MTEGLTQAALAAEPLLRRLADGRPIGKPADLAREFGRDENNTRRTIRNLRDEGFIAQDELALTDRADRALKALDFASGAWSPENATGPVIDVFQDDLSPHPHNPRKSIDSEEVQALACAIDAAGRILNALRVTPPDGGGHRYILAGQRRWLANGLLIADGRKGRRDPLPAIEQDVTETADVILLGMQENTGAPLSEIDDARALAFLCETKKWSAAECARQTGRLIKTVQDRLKILSRASEEDLAAVERGEMKYGELRTAVAERKPKPSLDLTPKLALLVAEIAAAAHQRTGDINGLIDCSRADPGGAFSTLRERALVDCKSNHQRAVQVQLRAQDDTNQWLDEIGFNEDRAGALFGLRSAVLGDFTAHDCETSDRYATDWLNPVEEAAKPGPVLPAPQGGEGGPSDASPMVEGAQGGEPDTEPPAIPDLTDGQHVAMVELCHLLATEGAVVGGRPFKCVKIGAFHGDPIARELIADLKLVQVFQPSGADWRAFLSPVGEAWRGAQALNWTEPLEDAAEGQRFTTPWLNLAPRVRDGLTGDTFSRQLAQVTAEGEESEPGWPGDRIRLRDIRTGETYEPLGLSPCEGRIIVEAFLALSPEQLTDIADSLSIPEADLEAFNRRVAAWVEPCLSGFHP